MTEQERHERVWRALYAVSHGFICRKFNLTHDELRLDGPCLLVSNHVSAWDPLLVAMSLKHKQIYFVASEHLFRKRLVSKALEYLVAPIPRRKASSGFETVKICLRHLKDGRSVGLFAEGEQSWDGRTAPIFSATGKLARSSGAALVTYRLEGAYLSLPRWGKGVRRGAVHGGVVNVYSPEQLKAMTPREINAAIERDISENAWERQKAAPVRYRGRRRAEGLERALFLCPDCGRIGTLRAKRDALFCKCGTRWQYTEFGFFDPPEPFENIADWEDWQRETLLTKAPPESEALGFAGGRSFGLSIAAVGYLVACVVGVVILNVLSRRGKLGEARRSAAEQPTVDFFQDKNEISVSDSIDKLSVQIAMVFLVYLAAFLVSRGITAGLVAAAPGAAATVNTLIWGFNFIIGSALAILVRVLLEKGRKAGIIQRQYRNNYLLNRISGFFFDIMIVAGIASIEVEDIRGLWVPFLLLAVVGAVVTWLHLRYVCKKAYPNYYYEGLISMFGMLTGTISSGVLLLRQIDPDFSTPAANNLITGSSFGIILGAPVLILVGLAPKSDLMCWVTLALAAAYLCLLVLLILKAGRKKKTTK